MLEKCVLVIFPRFCANSCDNRKPSPTTRLKRKSYGNPNMELPCINYHVKGL